MNENSGSANQPKPTGNNSWLKGVTSLFVWPPTGWFLGILDSFIVLLFSTAPLIFTVLILQIYPPTQSNSGLAISAAFAEYFGKGELLFIALAIGGSVAAKIWLDAQYRRYSNPLFNGPIVIAAVFAALISSGRVSGRQPDAEFVVTSSLVLLVAALGAYAWLIAKGPAAEPHSVDTSLKKSSDDLAERVRKLRSQGK